MPYKCVYICADTHMHMLRTSTIYAYERDGNADGFEAPTFMQYGLYLDSYS